MFDGNGKYETQWNNMHRPSGLYLERGAQGRFYVGEIGPGMAVNNDMPNIGPRVSIYSGQGRAARAARRIVRPGSTSASSSRRTASPSTRAATSTWARSRITNWGRRGPIPPGLRSLQKLVKVAETLERPSDVQRVADGRHEALEHGGALGGGGPRLRAGEVERPIAQRSCVRNTPMSFSFCVTTQWGRVTTSVLAPRTRIR